MFYQIHSNIHFNLFYVFVVCSSHCPNSYVLLDWQARSYQFYETIILIIELQWCYSYEQIAKLLLLVDKTVRRFECLNLLLVFEFVQRQTTNGMCSWLVVAEYIRKWTERVRCGDNKNQSGEISIPPLPAGLRPAVQSPPAFRWWKDREEKR